MSGLVFTAVIVVPFLVLAIFLLNGKGAILIAGFNTMGADKRAAYDEKALCKAVGQFLIALSALMMLFPIAIWLQQMWLFWVSFILVFILVIGFTIYANTGNRFRKITQNEESATAEESPTGEDAATNGESATNVESATNGERQPISKGKKLAIIISIIISAQILIGVGIMIFLGERDPIVSIHNDSIKISALYGLTIKHTDIEYMTLLGKNMRVIGIGTRTNGYSTTGQALKGNFSSAEHGQQLLFVYSSSSPTIQIARSNGADIYISYRDSEKTRETFRALSLWFSELNQEERPPASLTDDNLLTFTVAESVMSYTPLNPSGLHFRDLSAEEVNTLFHNLDIPRNVNASFQNNGALDSITAEYNSKMMLGVGQHHGNTMIAYFPGTPAVTDVYNIPVTALFTELGHPDGIFFQAYFNINDINYNITLREPDFPEGKKRLSEVVISIISNSGIDLSLIHQAVMAASIPTLNIPIGIGY